MSSKNKAAGKLKKASWLVHSLLERQLRS